jgi:hypothetical protein
MALWSYPVFVFSLFEKRVAQTMGFLVSQPHTCPEPQVLGRSQRIMSFFSTISVRSVTSHGVIHLF